MKKIFVAGHNGMVGRAIVKKLVKIQNVQVLTVEKDELNLLDQEKVKHFLSEHKPEEIYLAAAKVGGIQANNDYPTEFLYENLMIQNNVIFSAFESKIKKLLFLGSSCIYPKFSKQPIRESELLSGYLEPTNEPYAIAKIAGLKLCESLNRQYGENLGIDYRAVMPTNLYGEGDDYGNPDAAHVIPSLINKIYLSKIKNKDFVELWGTGTPKREFLFSDDLASACIFLMGISKEQFKKSVGYPSCHVNVGFGQDIEISELAKMICKVIGYNGEVKFDTKKPDGTPKKLLDSSVINALGWKPKVSLEDGLKMAYASFLNEFANGKT